MRAKLLLTIVTVWALPFAALAADQSASDQHSQDAELSKLLGEVNTAPADQKIGAIVTLLNKLVEQRVWQQPTPAPKSEKCMCCDMMKSDQSE